MRARLDVKVLELKDKDDKIIELTREAEVKDVKHRVRVAQLKGSYRCAKFDLIDAQKKIDELNDIINKENTKPSETEQHLDTELTKVENTENADKKKKSSRLQSVKEAIRRKFNSSCNKLYRAFSVIRCGNTVAPL